MTNDHYYTPEEVVQRHMGMAQLIARKSCNRTHPFEDVLQECLAALWDNAHRHPGDSMDGGLASKVMRSRAYNVSLDKKPWLGAPHVSTGKDGARLNEAFNNVGYYEGWVAGDGDADVDVLETMADDHCSPEDEVVAAEREAYIANGWRRIVRDYRKELDHPVDIKCLDMIAAAGAGNTEIAKALGMTRQGVSRRAIPIRNELRRRVDQLIAA